MLTSVSTLQELMERGSTALCGRRVEIVVDDLSDEEFDLLYDLMDEVYPFEESQLSAPSRLATEGRALPYMGRRRSGQETNAAG